MATNPHNIHHARSRREARTPDTARLEELKTKGVELLRDKLEEFKDQSDNVKAVVKDYVKEKPVKSLGLALLTGMVVALLLKR